MRLKLLRHLWGVTAPLPDAFASFKTFGYEGVEAAWSDQIDLIAQLARDHGITLFGIAFTSGKDESAHLDSLREQVDRWAKLGAAHVTVHSGSDAWPLSQSIDFYGRCVEYERPAPLPIAHETHRGRVFFNPWTTRDVLMQVPGIRLCCDYSHWVCVAERLLEDCDDILALAAKHCVHLHARVGYEEGPQVPDPSAPEYRRHLEAHERWWRMIWDTHVAAGRTELTVVPEYGPPGYLHTLPHTNVPVADLSRVVDWMSDRLRTQTFDT